MGGGISKMAKQELLATIRDRYRASSKREKSRILDEFIAVTGHHRKHGIRLLGQSDDDGEQQPAAKKCRRIYDEAVRQAVIVVQATNGDAFRRDTMGTVTVTIAVGDPQGRQFEEIDVVVDTCSTYTAVPRAMLQRLGVPVERSLPSETADGRIVPVDVGRTTIRLAGLEFSTPVIFAADNEPSLLGVVSLEEAALAVDPLAGRLIPTNLLRL